MYEFVAEIIIIGLKKVCFVGKKCPNLNSDNTKRS